VNASLLPRKSKTPGHVGYYPVLSQLAFNLLATPAMSTECERAFSKAGHVLNENRPRKKADYAEGNQCLRACISSEGPIRDAGSEAEKA
jgi:hypothetical protein